MKIKCFSKRKLDVRISKTKIKCAIPGICKIWIRYSRERAYLISLILIRPWSFKFSRALPPCFDFTTGLAAVGNPLAAMVVVVFSAVPTPILTTENLFENASESIILQISGFERSKYQFWLPTYVYFSSCVNLVFKEYVLSPPKRTRWPNMHQYLFHYRNMHYFFSTEQMHFLL